MVEPLSNRSSFRSPFPHSYVFSLAIVFTYLLLAILQINEPLHLDNLDFPAVAHATSLSGLPIYYRGEDLRNFPGLYHPPLYIYTLAGWFNLIGFGPGQARLFSICCALVAAVITLRGYGLIFGLAASKTAAPWFFAFYLLNPYALQCFAIADIDTSILPVLLAGVVLCCVHLTFENADPRRSLRRPLDWLSLFILLTLAFWSKLTTPLLFPFLVGALLSTKLGIVRGFALAALISILAFSAFVCSYIAFGKISGLDIDFTWKFLLDSFSSKSTVSGSIGTRIGAYATRIFTNFKDFGRWDMLVVLALAIVCFSQSLKFICAQATADRQRAMSAIAITACALFIVLFYSVITLPFSGSPFKYAAPAWPILAIAAAHATVRITWETPRKFIRPIAVTTAIGATCGYLLLQDRSILGATNMMWLQYLLPLVAALLIIGLRRRYPDWLLLQGLSAPVLALALICFLSGMSAGRAFAQAQKPYAKQYDYGQIGFESARDWLTANTSQQAVVFAMKDVASAAQRRYLESYGYILGISTFGEFEKRVEELNIAVFVFTERRGQDHLFFNKQILDWVRSHTQETHHFGDYVIFVKRSSES